MMYPCAYCEHTFPSVRDMTNHSKRHAEHLTYNCKNCQNRHTCLKWFHTFMAPGESVGTDLRITQSFTCTSPPPQAISRPHVCMECDLRFESCNALHMHMTHHYLDRCFQCPTCPKRFISERTLKAHTKTHEDKTLLCHLCGRLERSTSHFNRHLHAHANDRRFICELCGDGFKANQHLRVHLKAHASTRRPLKCTFCTRGFMGVDALRSHLKRVHSWLLTGPTSHLTNVLSNAAWL